MESLAVDQHAAFYYPRLFALHNLNEHPQVRYWEVLSARHAFSQVGIKLRNEGGLKWALLFVNPMVKDPNIGCWSGTNKDMVTTSWRTALVGTIFVNHLVPTNKIVNQFSHLVNNSVWLPTCSYHNFVSSGPILTIVAPIKSHWP